MQVNSPILNFSTKKTKLMKELTEVAWFIDSVGAKGQLFTAVDAKVSGLLLCHVPFRKVKTPVRDSAKVQIITAPSSEFPCCWVAVVNR